MGSQPHFTHTFIFLKRNSDGLTNDRVSPPTLFVPLFPLFQVTSELLGIPSPGILVRDKKELSFIFELYSGEATQCTAKPAKPVIPEKNDFFFFFFFFS